MQMFFRSKKPIYTPPSLQKMHVPETAPIRSKYAPNCPRWRIYLQGGGLVVGWGWSGGSMRVHSVWYSLRRARRFLIVGWAPVRLRGTSLARQKGNRHSPFAHFLGPAGVVDVVVTFRTTKQNRSGSMMGAKLFGVRQRKGGVFSIPGIAPKCARHLAVSSTRQPNWAYSPSRAPSRYRSVEAEVGSR